MDDAEPVTGVYPDESRDLRVTAGEAQEVVDLLRRFADDSPTGEAAGRLASELARRIPSQSRGGMCSIASYEGRVYLCSSCGQPCHDGEDGLQHFSEQWDGVFCSWFPLAAGRIEIDWDGMSLDALKSWYPDTRPRG